LVSSRVPTISTISWENTSRAALRPLRERLWRCLT
jgi:hypothetical protein